MVQVGRVQNLVVETIDERGAWLKGGDEPLLLPRREVEEGAKPGDELEVFVLRIDEQLVATRTLPRAEVGDFALLEVREVNPVGTFLDWGLPKDLMVPFSEQPERMETGRRYLVKVCIDERERVVATARIELCLNPEPAPYRGGEDVGLLLWRFTDLGAAMIVDGEYEGLLYRDELKNDFHIGSRFQGRIAKVREDGKLDVTLRRKAMDELEDAREQLREALKKTGGFLPLHDKSPPEEIKAALGMSKKLFKKALGGLLKAGEVELADQGIRLRG